jgi:hypothetical protein
VLTQGTNSPNERNTVAAIATAAALGGGVVKGLALDRPMIAAAFPHAKRNGKVGKWAAELVTGQLTRDVVPINGGTIKLGSKVLTTNAWRRAFQVSNGVGTAAIGASMVYGIPNLIDGWTRGGGAKGLWETRSGRTGLVATIGNGFDLAALGAAFIKAPKGPGRLAAALASPLLASNLVVGTRLSLGAPVIANEMGFLDSFNAGDERSMLQAVRDAGNMHVDTVKNFVHRDR